MLTIQINKLARILQGLVKTLWTSTLLSSISMLKIQVKKLGGVYKSWSRLDNQVSQHINTNVYNTSQLVSKNLTRFGQGLMEKHFT